MPDNFEDLANEKEDIEKEQDDIKKKSDHINSLFFNLVNNNAEAVKHLYERFCDVPVAKPGDDLLQIGIRQGKADLVRMIIQAAQTNNNQ